MKKFKFRLGKILQLKAHREKECQKRLALATQKVVNQEGALTHLRRSRIMTQGNQRPFLKGQINASLMSMFSRYYLKMKKDELTGLQMLKAFQTEEDGKRAELVEAGKERKIYEKLRERLLEAYLKELNLAAQKEQDEVASQMLMYKRNSRSTRELIDDRQ
jgi:flagellar FliJ protein